MAGVEDAPGVASADCLECKRHFLAISAAVVCLAGFLLLLHVDKEVVVDDKVEKPEGKRMVGLVLARGGSKGLPCKNLALVHNRTLLARALSTMQLSGCFKELWVSTDDEEIAEEAIRSEAKVHHRPKALAEDDTASVDAVWEFVDKHRDDVKEVGLVQCTSPFIRPEWLQQACHMIYSQGFDSVFSATRQKYLRWEPTEDGMVKGANFAETDRPRRQDWPGELVENGMFYFTTADVVMEHRLQGGRIGYVEVPSNHSLEVDTPLDLVLAQALATILDPPLRSHDND